MLEKTIVIALLFCLISLSTAEKKIKYTEVEQCYPKCTDEIMERCRDNANCEIDIVLPEAVPGVKSCEQFEEIVKKHHSKEKVYLNKDQMHLYSKCISDVRKAIFAGEISKKFNDEKLEKHEDFYECAQNCIDIIEMRNFEEESSPTEISDEETGMSYQTLSLCYEECEDGKTVDFSTCMEHFVSSMKKDFLNPCNQLFFWIFSHQDQLKSKENSLSKKCSQFFIENKDQKELIKDPQCIEMAQCNVDCLEDQNKN